MNFNQLIDRFQLLEDTDKAMLSRIYDKTIKLWKNPQHHFYTDHTPSRHSLILIKLIADLLNYVTSLSTTVNLQRQEIIILLASALLHDIGMQYEKKPELNLETVREIHEVLSYKMILGSVTDREKYPELGLEEEYALEIALVSKGHRNTNLQTNEYNDTWKLGEKIRLRFLSALLRIIDELDLDCTRVYLEVLKLAAVPESSRLHWWPCHYVESVSIEQNLINLFFIFPKGETRYIDTITFSIFQKIKNVLSDMNPILFKEGLQLILNEDKQYRFSPTKKRMPESDFILTRSKFCSEVTQYCAFNQFKFNLTKTKKKNLSDIAAISFAVFPGEIENKTWYRRLLIRYKNYPQGIFVLKAANGISEFICGYFVFFPLTEEASDLIIARELTIYDIGENHILTLDDPAIATTYFVESVVKLEAVPFDVGMTIILRLKKILSSKNWKRILTVAISDSGTRLAELLDFKKIWTMSYEHETHDLFIRNK